MLACLDHDRRLCTPLGLVEIWEAERGKGFSRPDARIAVSRLPRATPPPPPLDCPVHHRNGGTGTRRWSAAQLEEIPRLRSVSSRREVAAFYLHVPYLHVPSVGGPHHHGASPPHGFPQAADVRETCITGILLHEEETINLRRPEYRYVSICAQRHAVSVSKAGCYRCGRTCTISLTFESRVREDVTSQWK